MLRADVLERSDNRHWLFHPDLERLRDQARCEAVAKAYEQSAPQPNGGERLRYRLFGTPIHLVDRGWGSASGLRSMSRSTPSSKRLRSHSADATSRDTGTGSSQSA
ncbi:MAG: hypothetical protein MZU84_02685 [Sphingobacterium sp.]|nr:hypothetical protein [Sphingobacterium sp.]